MLAWLSVVGGLALLVGGAEWLVRGAVRIALALRIPAGIVGLTVVAAGTSLPELFVSVSAALRGAPDLSTGNVVGSNIYNIGLILGLSALIRPLVTDRPTIRFDWPVVLVAALALWGLGADGQLGRLDGALLLGGHAAYLAWLVRRAHVDRVEDEPGGGGIPGAVVGILVGLVGLTVGSRFLIDGATTIAEGLGVSQRVIGLTIVGLGTSTPELATSLVAAWRGQNDIAIGNVLGSNIFNVLLILGASALVISLPVHPGLLASDIPWMVGITVLLLPLLITGQRIVRGEGALLLGVAGLYTTLLLNQPG